MIENVMANDIADYIDVSATSTPEYALMGIGITGMGKTLNPQEDTKQYVSQASSTTVVKGYQSEYPFTGEMIKDNDVIDMIYAIGRNESKGADVQKSHIRVELFERVGETGTVYKAQKRTVSIVVSDMPREAGNPVGLNGSLKAVSDIVEGTFDTTSKTFTATV